MQTIFSFENKITIDDEILPFASQTKSEKIKPHGNQTKTNKNKQKQTKHKTNP